MFGDYMTEENYRSIGYHFASSLSLILLKGIGLRCYTHDYYWNNRKRSDQHCVLQYTLAGEGEIEIQHKHYPMCCGDAFFISLPGPHSYGLTKTSASWTVLYLEFTKDILPILHQLHSQCGMVFHIPLDDPIIQQALSLYQQAIHDEFQDIYLNSKAAYDFLMELCRKLAHQPQLMIHQKIEQCKQYIDEHYMESNLSLDELAAITSLSKFHMIRLFEESYGISAGRYITQQRMRQCARLLIDTNMTIDQIAQLTGYENGNYLAKVFKQYYALTPTQFRKGKEVHDISRILFET